MNVVSVFTAQAKKWSEEALRGAFDACDTEGVGALVVDDVSNAIMALMGDQRTQKEVRATFYSRAYYIAT